MNIGQVRYFVTVYEEGSFSRAARRLFVTVQATSKAIADLEREVGAELFERKSRGVEPTPFGSAFYIKAAPVLRRFEDLEAFAMGRDAATMPAGAAVLGDLRLALCSPAFPGYERVLANIDALIRKNIGIQTKARLSDDEEGRELLRKGEVDALITIGVYNDPETDCVPLLQAPAGIAMASDHPLARKDVVRLEDIAEYPLFVVKGADLTRLIYELHRARGLVPECEVVETHDAFHDVFRVRDGIMFCVGLPVLSSEEENTAVRPIAREQAVPVPICFVSLKSGKTSAYLAAERFLVSRTRASRA